MSYNQNNMTPEEIHKIDLVNKALLKLGQVEIKFGGKKDFESQMDAQSESQMILDDLFTAGVEAGKRESKWIPVEERLPESNNKVLVLMRYGGGNTEISISFWNERIECFDHFMHDIITHWQPLPSPPNPDKGGKEKE